MVCHGILAPILPDLQFTIFSKSYLKQLEQFTIEEDPTGECPANSNALEGTQVSSGDRQGAQEKDCALNQLFVTLKPLIQKGLFVTRLGPMGYRGFRRCLCGTSFYGIVPVQRRRITRAGPIFPQQLI